MKVTRNSLEKKIASKSQKVIDLKEEIKSLQIEKIQINTMISKDKQYKTRDGREVIIYTIEAGGRLSVHGACRKVNEEWVVMSWTLNGKTHAGFIISDWDLIEIVDKPKP